MRRWGGKKPPLPESWETVLRQTAEDVRNSPPIRVIPAASGRKKCRWASFKKGHGLKEKSGVIVRGQTWGGAASQMALTDSEKKKGGGKGAEPIESPEQGGKVPPGSNHLPECKKDREPGGESAVSQKQA